jgi:hypothetical protein
METWRDQVNHCAEYQNALVLAKCNNEAVLDEARAALDHAMATYLTTARDVAMITTPTDGPAQIIDLNALREVPKQDPQEALDELVNDVDGEEA